MHLVHQILMPHILMNHPYQTSKAMEEQKSVNMRRRMRRWKMRKQQEKPLMSQSKDLHLQQLQRSDQDCDFCNNIAPTDAATIRAT